MRYFNTFGGNSVAIAAAKATLDVIQQDGLMENSLHIGKIIHNGLLEIAARNNSIGDVRSAGLYFGVELVTDRVTKEVDMDLALAVVNGLRKHRVLISATGAQANILKIRPPLIFTEDNAYNLLDKIDTVFSEFK